MKFPMLKMLKEIQDQLSPVFSEHGLRAKFGSKSFTSVCSPYGRGDDSGLHMSFVDPKGRFFSPVEIDFTKADESGRTVLSWENPTMRNFRWIDDAIGDNGWRLVSLTDYSEEVLVGDKEANFETIEKAIGRSEVVTDVARYKRFSHNRMFGELCETVAQKKYLFGGAKISCARHDGIESCTFKHDEDDSEWRVALEGGEAVLYIDEQRTNSCAAEDKGEVFWMLSKAWQVYLPRRAPRW